MPGETAVKFSKVAGKIGVTAAASMAAIMMWGGGVAHADTNWGPVTPVSGSIGGLFTGIKCLDVNSGDGYLNDNSRVLIWDCMCLDLFNGDDDNGTKVEQWTCNGGGNQEFIGFPGSLS
jgi:hypothetical protein